MNNKEENNIIVFDKNKLKSRINNQTTQKIEKDVTEEVQYDSYLEIENGKSYLHTAVCLGDIEDKYVNLYKISLEELDMDIVEKVLSIENFILNELLKLNDEVASFVETLTKKEQEAFSINDPLSSLEYFVEFCEFKDERKKQKSILLNNKINEERLAIYNFYKWLRGRVNDDTMDEIIQEIAKVENNEDSKTPVFVTIGFSCKMAEAKKISYDSLSIKNKIKVDKLAEYIGKTQKDRLITFSYMMPEDIIGELECIQNEQVLINKTIPKKQLSTIEQNLKNSIAFVLKNTGFLIFGTYRFDEDAKDVSQDLIDTLDICGFSFCEDKIECLNEKQTKNFITQWDDLIEVDEKNMYFYKANIDF